MGERWHWVDWVVLRAWCEVLEIGKAVVTCLEIFKQSCSIVAKVGNFIWTLTRHEEDRSRIALRDLGLVQID